MDSVSLHWVGQTVCTGFSVRYYGKTPTNLLANPILLKELMSKCSHLLRCWGPGTSTQASGEGDTVQPVSLLIRCHGSNSAGSKEATEIRVQWVLQRGRTRAKAAFSPSSPVCTLLCPCPHLHPVLAQAFLPTPVCRNSSAISPPPQAPRGSNAPVTTKHFPLALSPHQ